MTHLLLVLAQHRDVQQRAVSSLDDDRYLDRVVDETLRQFPLFGIAHRITTADIDVDGTTIEEGSVLCFNYPEFQTTGFDHPDEFDPERWAALSAKDANYIPFGIAANRPCPAWRLAPITMRVAAREILRRYAMYSSVSHTRSIPHRGPCLLVRRSSQRSVHLRLTAMRGRDRIEDVGRSVVQLVLGTYMVADARRLRLTERYFDTHDLQGCPVGHGAR
jgi:cytochrome P450